MTTRAPDQTWPLAHWHIWHAPQRKLRIFGYAYEDSIRGVHRARKTGHAKGWDNWGLDLDTRVTAPCAWRTDCPRGLRGSKDALDTTFVCRGHAVVKHWNASYFRDRPKLNGRPYRKPISRTTLKVFLQLKLKGGYRPKTAERLLRLTCRLGGTPMFEIKSHIPAYEYENLHRVAVENGYRFGVAALPENFRFIRRGLRGPIFGMMLTRRTLTPTQADDLDGAKIGRRDWVHGLESQNKRVLGGGMHWGQSN